MSTDYSITLKNLIDHFPMEKVYLPEGWESTLIKSTDLNRPSLQLTGFFEYFDNRRIQLFGKVEHSYVEDLSTEERYKALEGVFKRNIPAMIVTRSLEIFPEMLELAQKHQISLLRAKEPTTEISSALSAYLNRELAPRITIHGVLVEVYGQGILILGQSGIGKSETAIELIKRGHRLIADDAVEIKRVSAITLLGTAPSIIRHFIELRGIGVVDVRMLFGVGSVKEVEKIDMVIELEHWVENKAYDRLGMDQETTEILGLSIPKLTVPVRPGRNLAVVIEVAAMNQKQRNLGYNAAEELNKRILENAAAEMGGLQ